VVTIPHAIATIIVIVGNVATDLNTSIAAPPKNRNIWNLENVENITYTILEKLFYLFWGW